MKVNERTIKGIWIGLLSAVVIISGFYILYRQLGKQELKSEWVAGDPLYQSIRYEDTEYEYREELINFLCLGVDKEEEMDIRNDEDDSIGQADAVFLVTLDTKSHDIQVLSIPRDTIVMLQMYDRQGKQRGTRPGQLTLQYAYGDGQEFSAELMSKRVAELLNFIPIHGYVAINLESLLTINDAVGGVDMTMDDDYTLLDPSFTKGATVHLEGQKLYQYIHGRDITVRGSSYTRINRMKQYMMAFFEKAKVTLKEDVSIVLPLLDALKKDMVTSLSADEITYLATEALQCSFLEENMHTIPGNPVRGEEYEEYYPDAVGIAELVIELFYEPVK